MECEPWRSARERRLLIEGLGAFLEMPLESCVRLPRGASWGACLGIVDGRREGMEVEMGGLEGSQ
jgi:hypothetical protein